MFNAFNGLGVCWAHFGDAGRAGSVKKKKKKIELKQSLVLPRPEVEPRTVELQMCAHVCVYRRMCVYVCMCVCVCESVHTCACVCIYVLVCESCVCGRVCRRECGCVHVYVCVCLCVCVREKHQESV